MFYSGRKTVGRRQLFLSLSRLTPLAQLPPVHRHTRAGSGSDDDTVTLIINIIQYKNDDRFYIIIIIIMIIRIFGGGDPIPKLAAGLKAEQ